LPCNVTKECSGVEDARRRRDRRAGRGTNTPSAQSIKITPSVVGEIDLGKIRARSFVSSPGRLTDPVLPDDVRPESRRVDQSDVSLSILPRRGAEAR
jgi:hypothetical protein